MLNNRPSVIASRRPRAEKTFTPLPPGVARYAPQMLLCGTCETERLADPYGVVLWHEVMKGDGSGQRYECAGANKQGLEIPTSTPQNPPSNTA